MVVPSIKIMLHGGVNFVNILCMFNKFEDEFNVIQCRVDPKNWSRIESMVSDVQKGPISRVPSLVNFCYLGLV